MPEKCPKTNRRQLLKGALAAGTLAGISPEALAADGPAPEAKATRSPDLIRSENGKPGTKDWLLTKTGVDPHTKHRCPWIEGYCSHTSIRAGERLSIMVSTNPVSAFTIDIYRLGYYGGDGGRLMQKLGSFAGKIQP